MKVLQLWKSDGPTRGGGGAGSMYRLHSNLRKAGIDSKILCEIKTTTSPHVSTIQRGSRLESLLKRVTARLGLNDIHRVSSFGIKRHEAYLEADVLNFHGIHSGFINYLALPSLTKGKPAVFTLRDMWCLTGHCAISYDCERWQIGCGSCPYLDAYPPVRRDATHIEWKLKDWAYSHSSLTIVALSNWLVERAEAKSVSAATAQTAAADPIAETETVPAVEVGVSTPDPLIETEVKPAAKVETQAELAGMVGQGQGKTGVVRVFEAQPFDRFQQQVKGPVCFGPVYKNLRERFG